jgi:hypothetical protein
MGVEKNVLNCIGESPRPYKMVAREVLINPDVAATSWRLFNKDFATLHCLRFRPPWALFVTDDPGLCCDMLVKLNAKNTHTLVGWDFAPEQLMCMCDINGAEIYPPAMPRMNVVEWEGVSDSTWLMKSAGGRTKSRNILAQVKAQIENADRRKPALVAKAFGRDE